MKTYPLTISTPDGHAFQGDASMLVLRTVEGELAILAGHIPLIARVKPCRCRVQLPDETQKIGSVDGGILTVDKDRVTLLTQVFRWESENEN